MSGNTEINNLTDFPDGETLSANMEEVWEQESNYTDIDSPTKETDSNLTKDMEKTEPKVQLEETVDMSECPDMDSKQDSETGAADDKQHFCHSDNHSGSTMSRKLVTKSEEHTGEDHSEQKEEFATTEQSETCSTSVDKHKAPDNDRTLGIGPQDEDEQNGVENVLVSDRTFVFNEEQSRRAVVDMGKGSNVKTLGFTIEETSMQPTGVHGGITKYILVGALLVLVLAVALRPSSPAERKDEHQVDIFLRELETVKSRFPSQRPELWHHSKIHLKRRLQTAHPKQPASLLLTAGRRAEGTLRCLAQGLASAFSSALNASALFIDGTSMASKDSNQVKLDLDSQLQEAFEGDKPVAVIHRFEALPPSSTLIFYRYCDHENAAYKQVFMAFTVLLEGKEELSQLLGLCTVEEMVDDHLQKKFLSSGHPVTFDTMDLDKYAGLWSRISHLILPVAAEDGMEHSGC